MCCIFIENLIKFQHRTFTLLLRVSYNWFTDLHEIPRPIYSYQNFAFFDLLLLPFKCKVGTLKLFFTEKLLLVGCKVGFLVTISQLEMIVPALNFSAHAVSLKAPIPTSTPTGMLIVRSFVLLNALSPIFFS
mmetsp:Transcript_23152/g.46207  ORF Transcript_23152/g.46207 Transcript_23152/m.46207 type:complete len:132 (+) Transcript_23152:33-428(+)